MHQHSDHIVGRVAERACTPAHPHTRHTDFVEKAQEGKSSTRIRVAGCSCVDLFFFFVCWLGRFPSECGSISRAVILSLLVIMGVACAVFVMEKTMLDQAVTEANLLKFAGSDFLSSFLSFPFVFLLACFFMKSPRLGDTRSTSREVLFWLRTMDVAANDPGASWSLLSLPVFFPDPQRPIAQIAPTT